MSNCVAYVSKALELVIISQFKKNIKYKTATNLAFTCTASKPAVLKNTWLHFCTKSQNCCHFLKNVKRKS